MNCTLDYIAGFTDAEGSFERRGVTSVRCTWGQKESNGNVLAEIQSALLELDIPSNLTTRRSHLNGKEYEPMWLLRTTWVGGRRFVMLVEDKLVVKGSGHVNDFSDPWEYLAGFFDGDGHLSDTQQRGYRTFRVVFTQKEQTVLAEIAKFLSNNGISSFFSPPKANGCVNLIVSQKSSGVVLKNMLPHLIVKRAHAEEAAVYLDKVVLLKEQHGYWYRRAMKGCD